MITVYIEVIYIHIKLIIVFVFLCLTYFTKHNILQVHPCGKISFFYGLVVSVCVCCVHVCVCQIFFIHSSADGHFSCFQILPIVNSAVINTEMMHVSFGIGVFIFFR